MGGQQFSNISQTLNILNYPNYEIQNICQLYQVHCLVLRLTLMMSNMGLNPIACDPKINGRKESF